MSTFQARLMAEVERIGEGRDRVVPPAATVARWSAQVRWDRFGITRLARLTDLDRIGIPVWASVRPNARTLAVCQGKGIDDESAQASALMEAIEIAVAERTVAESFVATRNELEQAGYRVAALETYLAPGASASPPDARCDWVTAHGLLDGTTRYVPAEAIVLDDTRASPYWRSTDGLASGNILAEAVLHGLCERIERDALALWSLATTSGVQASCIDAADLADTGVSALVERIAHAGLTLLLFDVTTDIAIPVFFAVLGPDARRESSQGYLDVVSGSGCHPVAAKAALRAITEAVQSRLTKIAATRDDFDPQHYQQVLPASTRLYTACRPSSRRTPAPVPRNALSAVMGALADAGIEDVSVVVLADEPGLAVAKTLVPGLENPPGWRARANGPRFVRRALGRR